MDTSWKLTITALGQAASELAQTGAGEATRRLMLGALGHELLVLAEKPAQADNPRVAARTLLLIAERAAKVAETAASLGHAGEAGQHPAITSAAYLAAALAAGALAHATPLLPQLADSELRANFSREFAAHTGQIRAVLEQINATT